MDLADDVILGWSKFMNSCNTPDTAMRRWPKLLITWLLVTLSLDAENDYFVPGL